MHALGVEFKATKGGVSITSYQYSTWHFMTAARHANRFLVIISCISGMLQCCKNLPVLLWRWTCWTCLNTPLISITLTQAPYNFVRE